MQAGETIASSLWAAAQGYPRRPAVVQGGHSWSFEDLAAHTRRLIGCLTDLGIRPGDPVALFLENSRAFIVAHYALATVGAVIVPLNHHFRGRPLQEALEMSEAKWVVTSSAFLEGLRSLPSPPSGLRRLLLDAGAEPDGPLTVRVETAGADGDAGARALAGLRDHDLPAGPSPRDDAVLFLSSGTTGSPKGIRVTNRQAVLGIEAWVRRWSYGPDTVSLMVAPFFHVVYNPLVVGAHRRGGAAAIVSSLHARAATREAEASRATAIMGTPFFYMQLLNDRTSLGRDLSSIGTVIYGAAPTPPPVIRALREQFPAAHLFNCYGLTETCSALSCLASDELPGHATSVGRAHAGVVVSIRGEGHRELPAGEVGEVWCRGPNVIGSYYKSPAADAARFHDGWLRTGDMGYLDRESFLYLLGRCDDQINIAGEKIYPCDIENVLYEHPDVLDVAVSVVPDPAKGELIKAFVVPRSDRLDLGELKRFCLQHLPPIFVPRAFELTEALPRNPGGKILRRKLSEGAPLPG